MSPAEKLLSTYYNSQDTGVSNFKTAGWLKNIALLAVKNRTPAGAAKHIRDKDWVWSPKKLIGAGAVGLAGLGGVGHAAHSALTSPDKADLAPLDLGEAKSEDGKDVPGTAAYAATGGVGAGLVSILYGKLADKPDLQRDLLSALAGTAAGAIVGSSKNKETE